MPSDFPGDRAGEVGKKSTITEALGQRNANFNQGVLIQARLINGHIVTNGLMTFCRSRCFCSSSSTGGFRGSTGANAHSSLCWASRVCLAAISFAAHLEA